MDQASLTVDSTAAETAGDRRLPLAEVLRKYWGYDGFLPLQERAMQCALESRDSVVVLPTGGGKSLCYQAPAVCMEGLTLVVSPLISLMKDQVDALTDCGVAAAAVHSMVSPEEKRRIATDIRSGKLRLLYCAPERVVQSRMLEFLQSVRVAQIAVDEAHCISSWGHDFRPEYRKLRVLKEALPGVGMHAYTATATERVRQDVAEQLGLTQPEMLVGSFDRPNLVYRVKRRGNRLEQIRRVIDRHPDASGIVYCISRKNVEQTAEALQAAGYRVRPYHAGMSDEQRHQHQEEFASEQIETIVATVAFGMGIDKSNVRYVIHAGMPKSLEQYQQESGRAGRDGLEAECWLLYAGNDLMLWRKIIEDDEPVGREGAMHALQAMADFCHGTECRHQAILRYFGQELDHDSCGACDFCLDELDLIDDAQTVGQKILSCVVRLEQRYGADYTAKVLSGSNEQRITDQRHDQLSTWGLLAEQPVRTVRDWIEQLVGQGFLEKAGEYNVLQLTDAGSQLLRGEATPKLLKPTKVPKRRAYAETRIDASHEDPWDEADQGLFESLRKLRRELAERRHVPAYIVFGDRSLRHMARTKPTSPEAFSQVIGVGEKKQAEYGEVFTEHIARYLSE